VAAKRDRLLTVLGRRERWREDLTRIQRLHTVVTDAEAILSGAKLEAQHQPVTNATVRAQYTAWCATLQTRLAGTDLDATERQGLAHFLHVTATMAPRLFACDDELALPRTNNDLEGFIRSVTTRYRRVSGRKHWNRSLIRSGARVAFYEARARASERDGLDDELRGVSAARWRAGRAEQQARQQEQIKQHRVRHRRAAFLADLEARWAALAAGT
jgi:hypothetical protein